MHPNGSTYNCKMVSRSRKSGQIYGTFKNFGKIRSWTVHFWMILRHNWNFAIWHLLWSTEIQHGSGLVLWALFAPLFRPKTATVMQQGGCIGREVRISVRVSETGDSDRLVGGHAVSAYRRLFTVIMLKNPVCGIGWLFFKRFPWGQVTNWVEMGLQGLHWRAGAPNVPVAQCLYFTAGAIIAGSGFCGNCRRKRLY